MSNPPLTIDQLRELMTKLKIIKQAYHSGKRSADDCIAELMAAPYNSPSPSSAMRLLDPEPPQTDTPPGWKSGTASPTR
jgi:hypothetical protein